jgi:hypothetical protein
MATYNKRFFEQCLQAIVSELVKVEEEHPDWPDNLIDAAEIVSDKARDFSAAVRTPLFDEKDKRLISREAAQTGAIVLRFLLGMNDKLQYDARQREWESVYYESAYY